MVKSKTKCTLVIPTYNRPFYLKRILSYYNKYGKYFIIVADSSFNENKKKNKKIISLFHETNIKHLDYPCKINAHHKMGDALSYIKTKYCVICADDDFVIPNGIEESIKFLEKNQDFILAHGHYIRFWIKNKKNKKYFCWITSDYLNKSVAFSDAKSRLYYHLSNYNLTTYAVHRTKFLKLVYKEFTKSGVDPLLFGELMPSVLNSIHGKIKCLKVFYSARDSDSIICENWPELTDFIRAGKYDKEYMKFRKGLSENLCKKVKIEKEESKKIIDRAMSNYIMKNYSHNHFDFLRYKIIDIINCCGLSSWTDKKIKKIYRKLIAKYRRFSISKRRMNADFLYLKNHSSKCYNELNKIRQQVLFK